MSRSWKQRPVRSRVLVAAQLCVTALALGVISPLTASASGPAARQASNDAVAVPAASSPGHSAVPVFSSADGVSCPRASYCVAVGAYNANDVVRVLTELWNGTSWSVVPSPGPHGAVSSMLTAVSCLSASHCVAVGSYTDGSDRTRALTEIWNGSSWAIIGSPKPKGGTEIGLSGVSCATASHCVAVGSYTNHASVPVTLTELWNGSSWSVVASPNPVGSSSSSLAAVSCASASACMAVGSDLDADFVEDSLAELWNGTSWSLVPSPAPAGAQGSDLDAVSCPQPGRCRAVGNYVDGDSVSQTLAESWNGSSWSVVASPTPSGSPSSDLYGISCAGGSHCLAVGHSYSPSSAAKDDTLLESWNGTSWSIVASPSPSTTSVLNGVSCATAGKCLAVGLFFNTSGDYQTLAESWDGSAMSIANEDAELAGVSCVNATHCIAVGSYFSGRSVSKTLVKSWNGHSWQRVPDPNPKRTEGSYLNAISCLSADRCVAVGYYYKLDNTRVTLVESWNGTRWSIVPSPNPSGAAYSVFYGISCTAKTRCMATGSAGGRVLAEKWNGSHWSVVSTPNPSTTAYSELADISCTSASHCLAVGYETDTLYHADLTLAEKWNGTAWSIVASAAPGKNANRSSVLHGLSCGKAGECLAVGYRQRASGTFATLTERWTGQRWVVLGSPSPSGSIYSDLSAISCIHAGECLAVGNYFDQSDDFVTLSETWTGTKWRVGAGPKHAAQPSGISYLVDVSCAASFTCLATGTHGSPANLDALSRVFDGSDEDG
jgi:hypothetical protein